MRLLFLFKYFLEERLCVGDDKEEISSFAVLAVSSVLTACRTLTFSAATAFAVLAAKTCFAAFAAFAGIDSQNNVIKCVVLIHLLGYAEQEGAAVTAIATVLTVLTGLAASAGDKQQL